MRVWVNADGFLSPLDFKNLASFKAGPPAVWNFVANAGDGRTVEIELRAEMLEGKNTIVFQFSRPTEKRAHGKQLPADADVRLTVRFDIEDRNFHSETKRNGGADFHFSSNTRIRSKFKIKAHRLCLHAGPRPPIARVCRRAANIIRSRNGAKIFRIRSKHRAARSPAATLTVRAGLKFRWPKARAQRSWQRRNQKPSEFSAEASSIRKPEMTSNDAFDDTTLDAPPNNLSSAATKAKPSSPVIRGFWIGDAIRSFARAACSRPEWLRK